MLSFYDYRQTADLSGKILKSLQLDLLQHCRAVADLCMFNKLRNNLANIAIPPILVPSVKHNCHHNHIQSHDFDALRYKFSDISVKLWNIISYHLVNKSPLVSVQPSSGSHPYIGTSIQA